MHAVITRARVRPGTIDACAAIFWATVPPLLRPEHDWAESRFFADRQNGTILILTLWRSLDAWRRIAASGRYQAALADLSRHFAGEAETILAEALVHLEASRESEGATNISVGAGD